MNEEVLNWGKPTVILNGWGVGAVKMYPAVEDSTELTPEEGEETEATIEGGEVEASRRNSNKYNLASEIRTMSGRKKPLPSVNGKINGTGCVAILPEDLTAMGILIQKANAHLLDSYTAADGGRWAYNFKALKPASGDQVKWGTFTVTGASGAITSLEGVEISAITKIEFEEVESEGAEKPAKITVYTKGS